MLKLADNLKLPEAEAVTQKYGFIGRSGSGKSYASMRLAELFLNAGAQIIALDWVGIWWSLRLASNGKDVGFPNVYIFGGEHQDVDLRPESGALIADLVVDKHISVVLDVMHFRKAERTRFATAFAEQFFHRKKTARSACHLFIEEAQAYLPQMVRGDEARMVGVFEDIGKVGRNYGIGNSLISQRPQAINKDVLNQVEVLLAFQTNGPQERKAIAGWTAENTTAGAAMMQELPKLRVGEALVWSPQWLRIAEKVHISKRETYDASRTPQGAAEAIRPKTLAKADLEQLGEQIAATIEKAKADDPRELRKELATVRKQLADAQRVSSSSQQASKPGKTALTDADRELLKTLAADFREFVDAIAARADLTLNSIASRAKAEIDKASAEWVAGVDKRRALFLEHLEKAKLQKVLEKIDHATPTAVHASGLHRSVAHSGRRGGADGRPLVQRAPVPQARRDAGVRGRAHAAGVADGNGNLSLGKMHRAFLTVLAQAAPRGPLTRKQLRIRSGYRDSGPVSTAFADLIREGYVLVDGGNKTLQITREGIAALGEYDVLPTGQALRDRLTSEAGGLDKMERVFLALLIDHYPNTRTRKELRDAAGYADSGPVSSAFAHLVGLDYVAKVGNGLRASDELFEEA
jgi:uncharacterized protein